MDELHGRDWRYLAVTIMAEAPTRTWTVSELIERIEGRALPPPNGPMSKRLSDGLRSAQTRGWVVRTGRGCYRLDRIPPTSARRARRWVEGLEHGVSRLDISAHANWRSTNPPGPSL